MEASRVLHCPSCTVLRRTARILWNSSKFSRGLRVTATCHKAKKNYYDVLGLKHNANTQQIRAAFVELSKQRHPDMNPSDPKNHDQFVQLYEAYAILSKPSSRRRYDLVLSQRLHHQHDMMQNAYSSHIHRAPPSSQTTYRQGDFGGEDPRWYDLRYQQHQSEHHYTKKGLKQGLAGCLILIALGTVYFFFALSWSKKSLRDRYEKVDRKNLALYTEARAKARQLGTAAQLERLTKQYQASQRGK